MAREAEVEVAKGTPPINLSSIPKEKWQDFIEHEVVPHSSIQKYLDGHHGSFTVDEVQNLEIAMENGYGVEAPLCIVMSLGMALTGRPWKYIETKNITGFSLQLKGE